MSHDWPFLMFVLAVAIIFVFWPTLVSKVNGWIEGYVANIKESKARQHSFWRVLQKSTLLKSSLRFPISFLLLGFGFLLPNDEVFPELGYSLATIFWVVSLVSLLQVLFAGRNKAWPLVTGFLLAMFSLLFAFYGISLSIPDRSQQNGKKPITYLEDFVSTTYQALRVLTLNAEPEFPAAAPSREQAGVETKNAKTDSSAESSGNKTAPTTASEKSASQPAVQSAGEPSSEQVNGSLSDQPELNQGSIPEIGKNRLIESHQAKNIGPNTGQQQGDGSDPNSATPLPPQSPGTTNDQSSRATDSGSAAVSISNRPIQTLGSDHPTASGGTRQAVDKATVSHYSLMLARLLALLFTLWGAYKITSILTQQSLDMLKIYLFTCKISKPPVLIVGLGHVGLQLVRELRQDVNPRSVIVLEKNENEPNIEHARRLGAIVLERNAFLPETLNELPFCAIREIYVVSGKDETNIDISINLMKAAKEQSDQRDIPWRQWSRRVVMLLLASLAVLVAFLAIKSGMFGWILAAIALLVVALYLPVLARFENTTCYVQIYQPNLQRVLHQAFEAEFGAETVDQNFHFKFFNSDLNAVTQLIVNKLTPLRPRETNEVALYIIVGQDSMWEEIAVGLTQLAHFENLKRSRMLILLDNPVSQSASFRARYPRFTIDNSVKDSFDDIHYDPRFDDWNYNFAGSPAGRTDVDYDDNRQIDQELSLVETGSAQPPTTPQADSGKDVATEQSKDEPSQPSGENQFQSKGPHHNPVVSRLLCNLRKKPFVRGLLTGLNITKTTDVPIEQQTKDRTNGKQPSSNGDSPSADGLNDDPKGQQPQVVFPSGILHRTAPAKYVTNAIEIEGSGHSVANFLEQNLGNYTSFRTAKTFGYEFATHTLFAPMPAHPADDSFLEMLHRIIKEQDIPGEEPSGKKRIIKPVILVAGRDEAKSYIWSRDFINQWYRYRAQNNINPPAVGDQSNQIAVSPYLFVWLPSERRLREVVEENKQAVRTAHNLPLDSNESRDILTGYFDHFGDPEESCEVRHIQAKRKEAVSNAVQISYDKETKGEDAIWKLMAFYGRGSARGARNFTDIPANGVMQAIVAHVNAFETVKPNHDINERLDTRHIHSDSNTDKSSIVLPMEVIGELRSKADRFIARVSRIADAMTVDDSIFSDLQDPSVLKRCVNYFGRVLNNDQKEFENSLEKLKNKYKDSTDSDKTFGRQAVTFLEVCFDFMESRIIGAHECLATWLGWLQPEMVSGLDTRSLKKRNKPLWISKKTFDELLVDISAACTAIVDQYSRMTGYDPRLEPAITMSENGQFGSTPEDSTDSEKEATNPDDLTTLPRGPNASPQQRKDKNWKKGVDKLRQSQAVIGETMQEILARCLPFVVAPDRVSISLQKFDNQASNEFAADHALIKYQIGKDQICEVKDTFDAAEFEATVLQKLIRSAIDEAPSVSAEKPSSTIASQDTSTGLPKDNQSKLHSVSRAEHLRWCAEMLMRDVQFVFSEGEKMIGADGKKYRKPEEMYLRKTLSPIEKLDEKERRKDSLQVEFVFALLDSMKEN